MNGFENAQEAWKIMAAAFERVDAKVVGNLDLVYSYHFTDIDWYCSVVLRGGEVKVVEGLLPESETTLEMSSEVFHQVMTGQMNVLYAHFSNKAKIVGSLGNVLKFRTIVPPLSEAYRSVLAERVPEPKVEEAEAEEAEAD